MAVAALCLYKYGPDWLTILFSVADSIRRGTSSTPLFHNYRNIGWIDDLIIWNNSDCVYHDPCLICRIVTVISNTPDLVSSSCSRDRILQDDPLERLVAAFWL